MHGGEISENTANWYGGGIYMIEGDFIMHAGEISENTANYDGGGIYITNGTFTMHDGNIEGNTAGVNAGGVKVDSYYSECIWCCDRDIVLYNGFARGIKNFTMTGGRISGNTAEQYGGGVYLVFGQFNIVGGKITDNSAAYGGGIKISHYERDIFDGWNCCHLSNPDWSHFNPMMIGRFTMSNSKIMNNIANDGGGIFISHNNTHIDHILDIANNNIFTGNVARNGLFINNAVAALNPQIQPGTVSARNTYIY